jgi:hypothetical protein
MLVCFYLYKYLSMMVEADLKDPVFIVVYDALNFCDLFCRVKCVNVRTDILRPSFTSLSIIKREFKCCDTTKPLYLHDSQVSKFL